MIKIYQYNFYFFNGEVASRRNGDGEMVLQRSGDGDLSVFDIFGTQLDLKKKCSGTEIDYYTFKSFFAGRNSPISKNFGRK